MRVEQVSRSCGEVTQPSVTRLPNLWRITCGEVTVRLQSNILLESATFQLHFGFSSSFSAIIHLNFICVLDHEMLNLDSVLTTLTTNTETNTAILSSQFDSGAVMGIYWRHYHVKNKKYGNFVSTSSLTGKCTAQIFLKNFCSSILWTCLHHMVILISQNKSLIFFMILA